MSAPTAAGVVDLFDGAVILQHLDGGLHALGGDAGAAPEFAVGKMRFGVEVPECGQVAVGQPVGAQASVELIAGASA